ALACDGRRGGEVTPRAARVARTSGQRGHGGVLDQALNEVGELVDGKRLGEKGSGSRIEGRLPGCARREGGEGDPAGAGAGGRPGCARREGGDGDHGGGRGESAGGPNNVEPVTVG